ncbi:MAG: ABC transporter ATP-binding protein [Armatimonadota bacterium]|nr:ABC transporter ATP-binding protein [Armatimonadota bacterium]MDR7518145.1 ABC transporter ATP-binding protein [Armatimonadota bacterium]MDR7550290.1 ABC transporter ATP-binding protein [Armatimonadota bacterium]
MSAVLRLRQVSRAFGGLQAVSRVSLDVEAGARLAIIGPNGAGKTTLFNLISGELMPTGGRIFALERDITRLPPHRRTALGLGRTYQLTNLFPHLTVLENMLLAVQALERTRYALLRPMRSFPHLYDRAEGLLGPLGLWDTRDVPVGSLSYGEQRQLELGLALAARPRILLLDEPTAGLSPAETQAVLRVIRGLPREITILLIEHDMTVVFGVCEHIVVLHQGQVVASGTPEAVRRDPTVRQIYLGAGA